MSGANKLMNQPFRQAERRCMRSVQALSNVQSVCTTIALGLVHLIGGMAQTRAFSHSGEGSVWVGCVS